jgi:hypothetical protein
MFMNYIRIVRLDIIDHANYLRERKLCLLVHLLFDVLVHSLNETVRKFRSLGHLLALRFRRGINHKFWLRNVAFLLDFFID